MKQLVIGALVGLALTGTPAMAQESRVVHLEITHTHDGDNALLCVPLSVSKDDANFSTIVVDYVKDKENRFAVGQLTAPGLLTSHIKAAGGDKVRRDLHVVLNGPFKAGGMTKAKLSLHVDVKVDGAAFAWKEKKGEYAELLLDKRPVLRYVLKAYDNTSTLTRDQTYKVFHHLYDPSGTRFVTNGGDTNVPMPQNPKDNLYPHHRGLMYAFNIITFDGNKKCDTWHAKPGDTHQSHEGVLAKEAGLVLGRHLVAVDWHGPKKEVFAKEEREITVYQFNKGTLVEFASRLKTTGGKVTLAGDPQHAGFQFRAHNDVHEQKMDKQTYYLRPDGKGELGDTRNWDPKTKKGPVNLPWDACSFVIDGKRYSVAYLDHPSNPKESRWSERDYGRFGCYFEYEVTEQRPLVVNYRVWLQDGEMNLQQVQALSTAFTAPPKVTVK